MTVGFFGIQFGWALQMGNMSAIYEYLGARPEQIPFLWLAAPLTGLIVQPIVGWFSDHARGRFGRRRPYMLSGALLSAFALAALPQSSALWMAAGLLWILDTAINVSMEPFRALVADQLPPASRTRGFAMQAFFIGLGAVLASVLPYVLHRWWAVDSGPGKGAIPLSVRLSFYTGALVFLLAVCYTVWRSPERPLPAVRATGPRIRGASLAREILRAIVEMPRVMRQLAAVQFFSWMGLFFMWIYFPVAIPRTCFGDPPVGSAAYTTATQWGSVCFGAYSLVTLLFSFALPRLAFRLGRTKAHALCLCAGGAGLLSVGLIHHPYLLFLPMLGVGVAWAGILSLPYAILSVHIPPRKMGLYMGIFNFFIVLPEIVCALALGPFLRYGLGGDKVLALASGGGLLLVAALLSLRVTDRTGPLQHPGEGWSASTGERAQSLCPSP